MKTERVRKGTGPKPVPLLRLGIQRMCNELKFTRTKVTGALQRAGFEPDDDGKFSLKQFFTALSGTGLEQKAKDARWEGVVAESDLKKLKLAEAKGQLVPTEQVTRWVDEVQVTMRERIRHAHTLSKQEQDDIITTLRVIGRTTT